MAGRVKDWISRIRNWKLTRYGQRPEVDVNAVSKDDNIVKALDHFEPYVMKIQSILVWENPAISALSIVIVNILFALAVSFEIRFYGLIFTTLLCAFLIDFWMEKIWPQVTIQNLSTEQYISGHSSRVLTMPEISHYLSQTRDVFKNYYMWLKNLRDDQPGTFCCAMCLLFALMTFIGRTIPGAVIGYCLLMLVMTGPGICIHLLPPAFKQRVSNFQAALRRREKGFIADVCERIIHCVLAGDVDSEVEEYLPEQSCETLALLQQVAEPTDEEQKDESLLVEEFGLDLASANLSGMPGHDEGSTDGLDISEFDFSAPPSLGGSTTNSHNNNHQPPLLQPSVRSAAARRKQDLAVDYSDDSDEDVIGGGIHFQSHHFNQDSSEEEEQAFVQGLVFPDSGTGSTAAHAVAATAAAAPPPLPSTLGEILTTTAVSAVTQNIANLGALGTSLISSVISGAVEKVSAQQEHHSSGKKPRNVNQDDSSSSGGESEFEMISHNDLT